MTAAASRSVPLAALLELGRISNLPTVWTNVLAGTVLAGGEWLAWQVAGVALAMSLFYVGGMYLNDYFDRGVDALERPGRPIPAGAISAGAVAAIGYGLLAAGLAVLAAAATPALVPGLALAAAVVGYDLWHKGNPAAPLLMGLCRALVYAAAGAAAAGHVSGLPAVAAAALLAYVAGLTYAARQESLDRVGNLWPLALLAAPLALALPALTHGIGGIVVYLALAAAVVRAVHLLARRPVPGAVPAAVSLLIAAISLVDAALLAASGALGAALLAAAGCAATLALQRHIAGT